MKALIFSDSHGSERCMRAALRMHRDAGVVFFLGDGLSDFERVADDDPLPRTWLAVRGNCDFTSTFRGTRVTKTGQITLEGHRIVYTHGDLFGVKYGLDGILRLAEEQSADLLLFGHTHRKLEHYESTPHSCRFFNPGSAGDGYDAPSFGLLTLTENIVLLSHGEVPYGF